MLPKLKLLVINGHGAKKEAKFDVNNEHAIITPGDANDSYIVSFDQGKITKTF